MSTCTIIVNFKVQYCEVCLTAQLLCITTIACVLWFQYVYGKMHPSKKIHVYGISVSTLIRGKEKEYSWPLKRFLFALVNSTKKTILLLMTSILLQQSAGTSATSPCRPNIGSALGYVNGCHCTTLYGTCACSILQSLLCLSLLNFRQVS